MPNFNNLSTQNINPNYVALTGDLDAVPTEARDDFTNGQELLDRLQGEHGDALQQIAERATMAVIHSTDPTDHPGVVTPADRSRPYKSYKDTAEHIGDTLTGVGFDDVSVMSDIDLLRRIADQDTPNPDFAWLNTAGVQGADPMAQTPGLLEATGIPYVGHPTAAYVIADHKVLADMSLGASDVPTPASLDLSEFDTDQLGDLGRSLLRTAKTDPMVLVKPINGRGSVGVERIDLREMTPKELTEKLRAMKAEYGGVKLDEYLPGDEVTVSAMQIVDQIAVLPPLARTIDPETGIFASLDQQAVAGRVDILPVDDPNYQQVVEKTARAYRALGLTGLARMDLRADAHGDFRIIDTNPKPDLGRIGKPSLSEISARACGLAFPDLIQTLLLSRVGRGFKTHPAFVESVMR